MSLDALAASFKAKTLPLRWWKLIMTLKALTAPFIGALVMVVTWHFSPDAPIDLSTTTNKVITTALCCLTAFAAGASALMWSVRKTSRPIGLIAVLLCGVTGTLACTMIFTIVTAQ